MIPVEFEYQRATSLDDAIAKLAATNGDGKFIAGGHSLVPLMKLRLSEPKILIDIARIPGLAPFPWVPTVKTVGAGVVVGLVGWAMYDSVPWPVGLAILAVLYLGLVHILSPNGPGGLRAFAGEPTDDLAPAIADDLTRRNLGTGEGE